MVAPPGDSILSAVYLASSVAYSKTFGERWIKVQSQGDHNLKTLHTHTHTQTHIYIYWLITGSITTLLVLGLPNVTYDPLWTINININI